MPKLPRSTLRQRRNQVQIKPGVWVRQSPEGGHLCKVFRCQRPPASLEPKERGMCVEHFTTYSDGRPQCKVCRRRFAVDPMAMGFCEFCSPDFQETTPFEAHVLDEIRKGASPIVAVQTAMGPGTAPATARKELRKLSRSAVVARRMKRAMAEHGLTDSLVFGQLKKNIQAKKQIFNGEGEQVAEVDDVRGSNQAIDIYAKLRGLYPGKKAPEPIRAQPVNVAVAVLPQEEPRAPDAQIYTLPTQAVRVVDGDE